MKIGSDERGGWSSDRPRRDGAPLRPPDVSVRCRVLRPSHRLRYSPGALVVIVSATESERERFTDRLVRNPGSLLSREKVRALLAGRVDAEELEDRVTQLLAAAVRKRLEAGETTVATAGLDEQDREGHVRAASQLKRSRHLILLEGPQDQVDEEDRPALNALRRRLDAGDLGAEGFQTAMRLGGASVDEVKALVFAPPPRDD